jgi:hypothetical protein
MAVKKNSHPVLRLHLDLSVPADMEVYRILSGLKSSIECKNFLLSAVLYYSRSPLVLSANALKEALEAFDVHGGFDRLEGRIDGLESLLREGVVFRQDAPVAASVSGTAADEPPDGLGPGQRGVLLSLRDQFKI